MSTPFQAPRARTPYVSFQPVIAALSIIASLLTLAGLALPAQVKRRAPSHATHRRSTGRRARSRRHPPLDILRINDPNLRDAVGPGGKGEAVIRAEILMDRLKFSPGEIGTDYNANLGNAIAAFQSASGLAPSKVIDPATWAALNDDQAAGHVEQPHPQPQGTPPQNAPKQDQQHQPQSNSDQKAQQQKPEREPGKTPGPAQAQPPAPDESANSGPAQPQAAQGSPPAVVSYMILKEDVKGPFTRLPRVRGRDKVTRQMLAEARLHRLYYQSPLELLGEKFHASPALLLRLNPGKNFRKAGEQIQVPNVLTPTPSPAASIVVNGSIRGVMAFDEHGRVLAFYPATVGSEHDPLPIGDWVITGKRLNPKFKYNPKLFWDAQNKRPRATLPPGPNSPVGVVWIDLSKEHYGIHGTPEPSQIGRTQSHGCIRLTNWDAAELAEMVKPGTPAILQESALSVTRPLPKPQHSASP